MSSAIQRLNGPVFNVCSYCTLLPELTKVLLSQSFQPVDVHQNYRGTLKLIHEVWDISQLAKSSLSCTNIWFYFPELHEQALMVDTCNLYTNELEDRTSEFQVIISYLVNLKSTCSSDSKRIQKLKMLGLFFLNPHTTHPECGFKSSSLISQVMPS